MSVSQARQGLVASAPVHRMLLSELPESENDHIAASVGIILSF